MSKEKYDWGIYRGVSFNYDYKDKSTNIRNFIMTMINRSMLMFKYEGLPETIPSYELERMLQTQGFSCFTKVNEDYYVFNGGLGGEPDVYGRPTQIVVSNPALKFNKTLNIDTDCVVILNDHIGVGLIPIYSKYGTLLAESEITMLLQTVNRRVNNLISVSDDNTAESAKEYIKKLHEGDIGYIFENKLFESLKSRPTGSGEGNSFSDIVAYTQYLKASMFNEIGLNANFNMKKERMITKEIDVNSNSIYPLIDNMLDSRQQAIDKINEMYGLNITVEFNSSWAEREMENTPPEDITYTEEGEEVEVEEVEVEEVESDIDNKEDTEGELEDGDDELDKDGGRDE